MIVKINYHRQPSIILILKHFYQNISHEKQTLYFLTRHTTQNLVPMRKMISQEQTKADLPII